MKCPQNRLPTICQSGRVQGFSVNSISVYLLKKVGRLKIRWPESAGINRRLRYSRVAAGLGVVEDFMHGSGDLTAAGECVFALRL